MSKLMISTQYCENYGSPDEPYWKFKGGNEYFVANVNECDMIDVIVDRVRDQVEYANDMSTEYILDVEIVADNYMTDFERSQLEYEGTIQFPAKVLEVA